MSRPTRTTNNKTGGIEIWDKDGNIKDENISRDSNSPGTLFMANTGRPNSGGSQFFLNVNDNANLNCLFRKLQAPCLWQGC